MKMITKRICDFIRYNGEKRTTIQVYIYSAYYRICIKYLPSHQLEKKMGFKDRESTYEVEQKDYDIAKILAFHVNRITQHTPWECKCLVRALTLKRLLVKEKISCTIYLGVKEINQKLVAHAWLRVGSIYMAGGMGDEYITVAKFLN